MHVHISGRVQRVFFRANTCERARSLVLCGWVRNTSSGGVEAVFEGERERLEEMLEFCRRGPPGARVTGVEVKWEDYKGEFSGFETR